MVAVPGVALVAAVRALLRGCNGVGREACDHSQADFKKVISGPAASSVGRVKHYNRCNLELERL